MKFISHTRHYMPNVNLKKTYNIMRLSVVLCMLSLFCASAKTGYSQVAEISLNLHNVTISEALEEIKHQSEYSFWYKNDEINLNEKISEKANKQRLPPAPPAPPGPPAPPYGPPPSRPFK